MSAAPVAIEPRAPVGEPAMESFDDDLLAMDLLSEPSRLLRLSVEAPPDLWGPPALAYLRACILQSNEQLAREPGRSAVPLDTAFLLAAVVRRHDVGPIRVVVQGYHEIVAVESARGAMLRPLLLFPGMVLNVEPVDALVLGRSIRSPAEAMQIHGAAESQRRYLESAAFLAIGASPSPDAPPHKEPGT